MKPLIVALALAALAGGCGSPEAPRAEGAWVRLPAVTGRPGAAYFTLHGGASGATLVSVATPAAVRTELHESMKGHAGMMAMRPIADIAVKPGATEAFAPGGRHVMLFDVNPALKPGGETTLRLALADGKTIEATANVVGAGDTPPK